MTGFDTLKSSHLATNSTDGSASSPAISADVGAINPTTHIEPKRDPRGTATNDSPRDAADILEGVSLRGDILTSRRRILSLPNPRDSHDTPSKVEGLATFNLEWRELVSLSPSSFCQTRDDFSVLSEFLRRLSSLR